MVKFMTEFVIKMAEEVYKRRPDARLPVIVELTDVSEKNVKVLSSKGLRVRDVIKSLNVVTGELPVDPKIAKRIGKLSIVKGLTTSCEVIPL